MNTSAFYVFGFFVAIIVVGLGLSYLVKRRGGNSKGAGVAAGVAPKKVDRADTDSKKTP